MWCIQMKSVFLEIPNKNRTARKELRKKTPYIRTRSDLQHNFNQGDPGRALFFFRGLVYESFTLLSTLLVEVVPSHRCKQMESRVDFLLIIIIFSNKRQAKVAVNFTWNRQVGRREELGGGQRVTD